MNDPGVYQIVLDSDSSNFDGHNRIDHSVDHHTFSDGYAGRKNHMTLYIPCRSAQVYAKK